MDLEMVIEGHVLDTTAGHNTEDLHLESDSDENQGKSQISVLTVCYVPRRPRHSTGPRILPAWATADQVRNRQENAAHSDLKDRRSKRESGRL